MFSSALPSRLYQDFGSGEACSRSGAEARPGSGCVASGQGFTSLSLLELLRFSGRSWPLPSIPGSSFLLGLR